MTASTPSEKSYKDTLNLPKTSFDMKANLVQREPALLQTWEGADGQALYNRIRTARGKTSKGRWILHDGPPYANGDIHMGHLINKVLKDIVVKFKTLQGYDAPYVPGWDCHGLPIESAILKELGPKLRELSRDAFRAKCHEYAMKFVDLQTKGFKRLGVFGDYARPYLTLDHNYEGGILDVFAQLVRRDLVYRQKKPVHWCTYDRTALAEAELEYQDRKDHSIYVRFPLTAPVRMWPLLDGKAWHVSADRDGIDVLIWTTTPWTLPANRAVAVHPDHEYVCILFELSNQALRNVIVAKELAERVIGVSGAQRHRVSGAITGREWVERYQPQYRHPLDPTRIQPVVLADYVTLEDGTGLVHTAPGHGTEDYQTGLREGLEIYNPVLPDGRYDDTVPEFLRGQSIWDGNKLVLDKLRETGLLFHDAQFQHSYPHCWRCKKPTIFRATEQWFVKASGGEEPTDAADMSSGAPAPLDMPHDASDPSPQTAAATPPSPLWSKAKAFVSQTQWIPAWGKNRIDGMLDTRPDWCISRQRNWGVPIPAFYDAQGKTVLTEATVKRIATYFREHGADSWYRDTPAQILGVDPANKAQGLQSLGLSADLDVDNFEKGFDILDVWFESGASHHAVLECTHPKLGYPVDLYLEGSDQHRGWFQATLLESAGYKDQPPYKQVLTHGFVVDEKGRKMSKSEGNDIKVADALKRYGADVLRLWVASVDYQNDIPCGWKLFDTTGEAYRKIRNTIRYLLGNLYDFSPTTDTVAPQEHSIDTWMQRRVDTWARDVWDAYEAYEFHRVFKLVYEFCNVEISAVYAKAIKDRLYCDLPTSPRRRASQTVCYRTLLRLVELVAPVLAFTAEEAWAAIRALPGNAAELPESVHLHAAAEPARPGPADVDNHWVVLMELIESGNKQLDDMKKSAGLKNALDAEAVITVPEGDPLAASVQAFYGPEIEDALGVGYHRIATGAKGGSWALEIRDTREAYPSCARSWKRRPDVGSDPDYPDLSARDAAVVKALRS